MLNTPIRRMFTKCMMNPSTKIVLEFRKTINKKMKKKKAAVN